VLYTAEMHPKAPQCLGAADRAAKRHTSVSKCFPEGRCAASWLQVSLMVPWIAEADQRVLFKDNVHFSTPQEQVAHGTSREYIIPGPCWAHSAALGQPATGHPVLQLWCRTT
jgi:hypothetical protein